MAYKFGDRIKIEYPESEKKSSETGTIARQEVDEKITIIVDEEFIFGEDNGIRIVLSEWVKDSK